MNSKWYVALVSACVAAITLSACNQNGAAESQPLEQSATSGHPNSSTSSSVGEASKPDWLVGGWIPAGSDCDSGEGISIDKDYTWSAEGVGGKWSLEGETIKLDETYSFDDNGNKVRSSGAPPMFIEYKGDNEFQFKGEALLWKRCGATDDTSAADLKNFNEKLVNKVPCEELSGENFQVIERFHLKIGKPDSYGGGNAWIAPIEADSYPKIFKRLRMQAPLSLSYGAGVYNLVSNDGLQLSFESHGGKWFMYQNGDRIIQCRFMD